ncbi:MAG: HlyD family efflux transporter periplasmic adaptor subunit [Gemmatimonadales bacterium]|nr:HlyD family efflux transporter periplasmic adaptor subunit [Gemmatimonadales bacterium]
MAGVAVGLLAVTTVGLGRLKPAAPSVERSAILLDQVKRGLMLRQVRGPGTLVPEQIRWISAVTGGRVERVNVRPGTTVEAGTVLLQMSNPDVQLEALSAQQQLAAAQSQLVSLRTSLETQRLNQRSTVTTVRNQLREAQRNLATAQALTERNLVSQNELSRARDQVDELNDRLAVEQQRLEMYTSTVDSQVTFQRSQVDRLRAIADFQQNRVASMHVVAGTDGVVQELSLEVGQWVQSGTTLVRVVQPGRLKAVLRIPETQASDVPPRGPRGPDGGAEERMTDAIAPDLRHAVRILSSGPASGAAGCSSVSFITRYPVGAWLATPALRSFPSSASRQASAWPCSARQKAIPGPSAPSRGT